MSKTAQIQYSRRERTHTHTLIAIHVMPRFPTHPHQSGEKWVLLVDGSGRAECCWERLATPLYICSAPPASANAQKGTFIISHGRAARAFFFRRLLFISLYIFTRALHATSAHVEHVVRTRHDPFAVNCCILVSPACLCVRVSTSQPRCPARQGRQMRAH